jgi:hypothetical protein
LNISKILKRFWESTDRDVKNLTNDLIVKWKKITKAASASAPAEAKIGKSLVEIFNPEMTQIRAVNDKLISKIEDEQKVFCYLLFLIHIK